MKKVLFAVVLACGLIAFSSCSKECNCVGKYNGEVVYETSVSLEDGDKCSDYNKLVNIPLLGVNAEVKCTPVLF
jgi:hypothetical protein